MVKFGPAGFLTVFTAAKTWARDLPICLFNGSVQTSVFKPDSALQQDPLCQRIGNINYVNKVWPCLIHNSGLMSLFQGKEGKGIDLEDLDLRNKIKNSFPHAGFYSVFDEKLHSDG